MLKIAIVVSHPIQHFCPQYVSFATHPAIKLKVFFASALGYKKYLDPNFKNDISWGNLSLDKFDHVFLNGERVLPSDRKLDASSLDEELKGFEPGLIVIYGYFQRLQRRAHQWAVKNSVALAYISDSELRHKRNPLKEFIKSFFIKRHLSKIDLFLSVGDSNEEFYRKHNVAEKNILRMHFPIDLDQYTDSFQKREVLRQRIRNEHAISKDRRVLIVVGKLVPWKNQDHLIDALQLLEESEFYLDLFIVGSGFMEQELKAKAKKLIHSRVHFTGFVSIEKLPLYYAASDIYVHAASVEPHSIAVSEAIYMGLPVIISDRCGSYGPTDDVQIGKNGFVYRFGDIEGLAQQIHELSTNQELMEKFGEHSHESAVEFQNQAHKGILEQIIKRYSSS